MKSFNEKKFAINGKELFDFKRHIDYWIDVFNKVRSNKIDTWDYQLVYSLFYHGFLCIIPKINLVQNIGFSSSATHTKTDEGNFSKENFVQLSLPIIHPKKITKNKKTELIIQETIYGSFIKENYFSKIKRVVKQLIN
jgi:hypothetical protein